MSKRILLLLSLLVVGGFVLAACGDDDEDTTPAPAEEVVVEEGCSNKIGFVTDVGKLNDQSFNESGWNGVMAGAETLGLSEDCFSFIETTDSADYTPNIESFIDQGFDIIVTSGFAMGGATHQAGKDHPDVFFIGTDQTQTDADFNPEPLDNVTGLIFHEDISGYLAGALAGLTTESNIVGGVFGCPFIPPVARFEVGYYNGVKAVNPDATVIDVYHPGALDVCFIDSEFGAETAGTLIAEGADVIFGAGGLTGNGALIGACNEGVNVIGVDTDQFFSLPEAQSCIMSSATKGLEDDVASLVVAAANGTFPGGEVFGPAVLAPFHEFEDVLSDDVKAQLADLAEQLNSGELDPCTPFEGSNESTFCTPVGS